jgi:hypothetical protein
LTRSTGERTLTAAVVNRDSRGVAGRQPVGAGIAAAAATVLAGALACTSFEDGTDTLPEAGGSTGRREDSTLNPLLAEAQPGEDWACLSAAAPPATASADTTTRAVYSLQVVDLGTNQPYTSASVRACGLTDVECMRPVVGPLAGDQDGRFEVPLFEGFTGYLEVTGPDIMSGLLVLPEPLSTEPSPDYPFPTLSFAVLESLGGVLGIPVDPASGLVAVRVLDCNSVAAPGVSISKPGAGVPWYFVGGLPSVSVDVTDSDGLGGFVNTPAGLAQVEAATPDGASVMGPLSLIVRAGWSTTTFMRPPRAQRSAL